MLGIRKWSRYSEFGRCLVTIIRIIVQFGIRYSEELRPWLTGPGEEVRLNMEQRNSVDFAVVNRYIYQTVRIEEILISHQCIY